MDVDVPIVLSPEDQLFDAAIDGNVMHVKQILQFHPFVNIEYNETYCDHYAEEDHGLCTALFASSSEGHHEVVEELIKAGADIESKDSYENTCLMFAVYKGRARVVQLLINAGCEVDVLDNNEETCLMDAARHGYTTIAEMLLQANCNVLAKNLEGETALDIAKNCGNLDVVSAIKKELVRRIVDLTADIQAYTAHLGSAQ
jgi:ankyrin repeat protein